MYPILIKPAKAALQLGGQGKRENLPGPEGERESGKPEIFTPNSLVPTSCRHVRNIYPGARARGECPEEVEPWLTAQSQADKYHILYDILLAEDEHIF